MPQPDTRLRNSLALPKLFALATGYGITPSFLSLSPPNALFADFPAHCIFLLVQGFLLFPGDMAMVLCSHVTLFLADLMIFLVKLVRLILAHLPFLDFVVNAFVLVCEPLVDFVTARMRFGELAFIREAGARDPGKNEGGYSASQYKRFTVHTGHLSCRGFIQPRGGYTSSGI